MSWFISRVHTDLRRARLTRRGATALPQDVPTGRHKTYPRMEQIVLPAPEKLTTTLETALTQRRSSRRCPQHVPLSLQDVSTLLEHSLRKRTEASGRPYPSGGALYPIETYLLADNLSGTRPGVFHYNPTLHNLERLWGMPESLGVHDLVAGGPDELEYSALIIFTAVWARSSAKYGDFAYTLSLLEAGHMSENVLLVSTAMRLEGRPMAGFKDDSITQALDLDEALEQPVLAITLGKPGTTMETGEDLYTE